MSKKDHCSYSPDRMFGYDWSDECRKHDEGYYNQWESRNAYDIELRENMKSILPLRLHFIAWIYYFGVRFFGWVAW